MSGGGSVSKETMNRVLDTLPEVYGLTSAEVHQLIRRWSLETTRRALRHLCEEGRAEFDGPTCKRTYRRASADNPNKKAAPNLDGHATQRTGRRVTASGSAAVPAAKDSAPGPAVAPERASAAGSDFGSGSGRPFESPVVREGSEDQRADVGKVRA